jgi:cell wall-associated NlpC family hydrolase
VRKTLLVGSTLACLMLPGTALAATSDRSFSSVGGVGFTPPPPPPSPNAGGSAPSSGPVAAKGSGPTVPGVRAKLIRGVAYAPASAPIEVQRAIWAGNHLRNKPYRYGGGHRTFKDTGYDCSGTVSYALRAAGVVDSPLDSSSYMRWGERGRGDWITVYTNPGHAFVVIAGLRLDTSAAGDPRGNSGPRWRPLLRSTRGFAARHPEGF